MTLTLRLLGDFLPSAYFCQLVEFLERTDLTPRGATTHQNKIGRIRTSGFSLPLT